jgi:hypothetical protein
MNDKPKHINIIEILNNSPSVILLRMKKCNIIVEFLTNVFNETMAVSHENIHSFLADFLNNHDIESDEENDILYSDTYEEKAIKYIKKWTDSGFLTNYRNEDGEIYVEAFCDQDFNVCNPDIDVIEVIEVYFGITMQSIHGVWDEENEELSIWIEY